jgi:hypothetical protein
MEADAAGMDDAGAVLLHDEGRRAAAKKRREEMGVTLADRVRAQGGKASEGGKLVRVEGGGARGMAREFKYVPKERRKRGGKAGGQR